MQRNREPWLALLYSELLPGLGHYYGNKPITAIIIILSYLLLLIYGLWSVLGYNGDTLLGYILLIACLIVVIYSMVHSFNVVKGTNSIEFESNRRGNKDPYRAIFFSVIVPGLGHLYIKKRLAGYCFILIYVVQFFLKKVYILILVWISSLG